MGRKPRVVKRYIPQNKGETYTWPAHTREDVQHCYLLAKQIKTIKMSTNKNVAKWERLWGKGNLPMLLGGSVCWCSTMEDTILCRDYSKLKI